MQVMFINVCRILTTMLFDHLANNKQNSVVTRLCRRHRTRRHVPTDLLKETRTQAQGEYLVRQPLRDVRSPIRVGFFSQLHEKFILTCDLGCDGTKSLVISRWINIQRSFGGFIRISMIQWIKDVQILFLSKKKLSAEF